jgi:hypothetical protein
MSKITQKEAVFTAIVNVLGEKGIEVTENMNVAPHMTREVRSQVNQILFEGFKNSSIELDREFSDTDLKAYVSGLQSNWIRKDKRLNGNVSYIAKNPGSRVGSGDASLKAMRALLSTLTDESEKAEVQTAIDARLAEISVSKAKTVKIDFSALPSSLQEKFSK